MPPTDLERRFLPAAQAEVRLNARTEGLGTIVGTAVVYNSLSEDLGWFREIIKPGAFTESLKTADVRCLIDHLSHLILGRNTSNTLRLRDDEKGLHIECDLPDVSYARDLTVTMDRRDVTGMSFRFNCLEDEIEYDKDRNITRTVLKAEIFDVSVVTFPAYTATTVSKRSIERFKTLAETRVPNPGDQIRKARLDLNRRVFLPMDSKP